ncbi:unnamed protein product [Boreogadus saida]
MEDQNPIVAVCSRPALYDRNKKERTWPRILSFLTSPAVSQTQRTLMLLLLLSLPLALPVYLSLPQDHRAGRRGREPGYQRGTQICRVPSSSRPANSSEEKR